MDEKEKKLVFSTISDLLYTYAIRFRDYIFHMIIYIKMDINYALEMIYIYKD